MFLQHAGSWAQGALKDTHNSIVGVSAAAAEGIQRVDWEGIGSKAGEIVQGVLKDTHNGVVGAAEEIQRVDWEGVGSKAGEIAHGAQEAVAGVYHQTEEATKENPKLLYAPAGVVVGAALAPILMGPVLATVGFSSAGPVAGSLAAGLQSAGMVGPVFSTLQSAAMGGYGVGAVMGAFVTAGGAAGAAAGSAMEDMKADEGEGEKQMDEKGVIGDVDKLAEAGDPAHVSKL